MHPTVPLTRDLVLVGGGHSHALVLRAWGMSPVPGARLTVIHPGAGAAYSGMLPGHIAGHYPREALEIDIVRLARFAGAQLITDRAVGIDRQARQVRLETGGPVGFDLLSLDIGVTSQMPQLPGFTEHALPAKPLDRLADGWAAFTEQAGDGAEVVVIGGGVAGVELALAAHHRLRPVSGRVTVVERGEVLAGLPRKLAHAMRQALSDAGVTLIERASVARVSAAAVHLADGRTLRADCVIGAGGARPHPWVAETGLRCEAGYLVVDETLRSVDDPAIYASGDCAHLAHAPRPKAGVFAVRAAPVLARNLRADLTGSARRRFAPQRDYLKLISLGTQEALGEKAGLLVKGAWVWRWKDRIDRAFMDKLSALPAMRPPRPPANAARDVAREMAGPAPCGGCAAKVGPGVLSSAVTGSLSAAARRPDIELRAGDDAAVLRLGRARQVLSTDQLRAFALDPRLVARVAALHALGDIWAMGAAPQAALAQITLPRMTERLQSRTLAEIMAEAEAVMTDAGAEIVGGHTMQGDDLQIGFTVTGLLDGPAITTAGAQPGDALLLTRGIGTGVVLAAEMAGRVPGGAVLGAWHRMGRSQAGAARALSGHAHAMTDVTGFGLAGHLWEICERSGLAARIELARVPLLPGAEAVSASGVASTLMPANRAHLAGRIEVAESPAGDLLFDPQTAGGFLAALPPGQAEALLPELQAENPDAAIIGHLIQGPPGIEVTYPSQWP